MRACFLLSLSLVVVSPAAAQEAKAPTRRFEVRGDRPFLGGQQIDLWGIRCGNALMNDAVTERHIRNFDNFIAYRGLLRRAIKG